MNENEAIHTENLTRSFAHTPALDNLSLSVPAGLIFGFLGPNGAGKTTTIRLLLGLLEPDAGHAQVLGYDVQKQAYQVRANVGALLEHTGLYERLSAEDNLEFYGRVWQMSSAARQQRTRELLSQMGLWERRKETVGTWSKGMKQKLAVARALYHRPKLVFLDEPTDGLDPVAADQLHQTMIKLAHNTGLTIFLTTHNLAEAEKLCQLVGVIRQGQLIAYGPPNQLYKENAPTHAEIIGHNFSPDLVELLLAQPQVAAVKWEGNQLEVALKSPTSLAPLVTLVVSNGGQVEEVRENKANLEETFLSLMKEERKP